MDPMLLSWTLRVQQTEVRSGDWRRRLGRGPCAAQPDTGGDIAYAATCLGMGSAAQCLRCGSKSLLLPCNFQMQRADCRGTLAAG